MARSFFFIFAVILLIAVSFIMVVAVMNNNQPTEGIYNQSNKTANQTQAFIMDTMNTAPNWITPAIFVSLAVLMISVVFLIKR